MENGSVPTGNSRRSQRNDRKWREDSPAWSRWWRCLCSRILPPPAHKHTTSLYWWINHSGGSTPSKKHNKSIHRMNEWIKTEKETVPTALPLPFPPCILQFISLISHHHIRHCNTSRTQQSGQNFMIKYKDTKCPNYVSVCNYGLLLPLKVCLEFIFLMYLGQQFVLDLNVSRKPQLDCLAACLFTFQVISHISFKF